MFTHMIHYTILFVILQLYDILFAGQAPAR